MTRSPLTGTVHGFLNAFGPLHGFLHCPVVSATPFADAPPGLSCRSLCVLGVVENALGLCLHASISGLGAVCNQAQWVADRKTLP